MRVEFTLLHLKSEIFKLEIKELMGLIHRKFHIFKMNN